MAYIPYTPLVPESDSTKSTSIPIASNGAVLSDEKGKGSCFLNLDLSNDMVRTRRALVKKGEHIPDSGTVYSITKKLFCDRIVLHVGSSIYTYSENGSVEKINFTLPDKQSVFAHFMSCLYIYCDYRIFKLNDAFEIEECEPYVPTLFENVSWSLSNNPRPLDVPHNILSPVIRVKYKEVYCGTYKFPYQADISRPIRIYDHGVEIDQSLIISFTEDQVKFDVRESHDYNYSIEIVYYLKNPSDMGFDDIIYRCKCVESFGGAVGGGTRIFFTGDSDKKGYYYKSELQNPLYVASDEYEIIGDGCENVTAVIKMYGQLIMLTEKGVYQMEYSLNENGALFTVKQLTNAVGCDMPNSVQLVDNRVVFANTKGGVYIIDAVEDNGEHNIKPLSYNIIKGNGLGLLDNEKELLSNASSCDFDRCYYLFVGDKAYIWDYDESPYVESGSYSKAQKRLNWYIYDGLTSGFAMGIGNGFVIFSPSDYSFYGFGDTHEEVEFSYSCESESFGREDIQKYVTGLTLVLSSDEHKQAALNVYGDGSEYYKRNINICGKKKCISIVLPKKPLFDFSYSISGVGDILIHSAIARYTYLSK